MPKRSIVLFAALLAILPGRPLSAQTGGCSSQGGLVRCPPAAPDGANWQGHALALGLNAAVGGVSAGILQMIRGGSFRDGFRPGSLGGGITYVGKVMAVESFFGAGFLGREVAAVGSSISHSAALGEAILGHIVLPIGPSRVYLRLDGKQERVHLKLDVAAAALLAVALLRSDLDFDGKASLSSGAFVFHDRGWAEPRTWAARHWAGVIMIRGDADWRQDSDEHRRALAHERVHVLQYDQAYLLWGEPLERAVLGRIPGGISLGRRIDLALETPFLFLLQTGLDYGNRPWEVEADFLSGTKAWSLERR